MQAVSNSINDAVVVRGSYLSGWVENQQEVDQLLETYNEAFNTVWATRQTVTDDDLGRRFMWRSRDIKYDGIPFITLGKFCGLNHLLTCTV